MENSKVEIVSAGKGISLGIENVTEKAGKFYMVKKGSKLLRKMELYRMRSIP